MATNKHVVVTHFRPQVSDLFLLWQLKHFGDPEVYANIEEGIGLRYLRDGGRILRDKEGEFRPQTNSGKTYSGVGGGKYDEHGKRILECEASLVGRDLGLLRDIKEEDRSLSRAQLKRHTFRVRDGENENWKYFFVEDEKLRDLFAATVRDDISGSPIFSLGNLVDTLYRLYPTGMRKIMNWTFVLFNAASCIGHIPREEREAAHKEAARLIRDLLEVFEKRGWYPAVASRRLRGWLDKRYYAARVEPLNVVDSVAVMKRAGADYHEWLKTALHAELSEQRQFHTVTAEEAKKAKTQEVLIRLPDGSVEKRFVAVVESDDSLIHKLLVSKTYGCDAAIVVRKKTNGQVQIWPGSYQKKMADDERGMRVSLSFLMPTIAAFIRAGELRKKGLQVPPWDELVSDHGPKNDFTWFFYSKPGWIMNGSLTATDVPPSDLTLFGEIVGAVLWAVDEGHVGEKEKLLRRLKDS